jgi:hypothetical protein
MDHSVGAEDTFSADEQTVLQLICDRLARGRRDYGPLHIDSDPRDWHREALEELLDATIYHAIALVRCLRSGTP